MSEPPAPPRVLVVCTANVCRSPVVERLLPQHARRRGVPLVATSAGTHGGRNVVHPHTVAVAAERGIDLSEHRSRRLTRRLLDAEGTGLIVALAREHLYEVVATDEATWPRTFTLVELARRAESVASAVELPDSFDDWVVALGRGRTGDELIPGSPADDVADPYGRARRHHRAMVREVDELCGRAAAAMASAIAGPDPFGL